MALDQMLDCPSIFSIFLPNSALVPLHSLEAFEGSLTPSTANISRPINPSSSQTSSTSRNTETIGSPSRAMKAAMVVKCGRLSADSA